MGIKKNLISIGIILFSVVHGWAQVDDLRHFTINCNDSTIKSSYHTGANKTPLNPGYTYYWYYDGKINHNQGGYSGKLLDGTFEVFDGKGRLMKKGQFKAGLKQNQWVAWYSNGKMQNVWMYKNGYLEGKIKRFDELGNLLALENYKTGLLHGKCIYYENGTAREKVYKKGMEIVIFKKESSKKFEKPGDTEKPDIVEEKASNLGQTPENDTGDEQPRDNWFKRTIHNIKGWFAPKNRVKNPDPNQQ
jgi:hypothetical protein